ncbi:flagellar basal body-associated protein FliL [Undibacterium flavidum]|uniref:Flagellar protein FliL n=1 Tax=Undibacterium flavidum TaxID=2762297 RepID=A0ABR6Y7Z1_9BURK|nr:flagellar basal body-associated protein FliL [Undibacterium flavidum]MBC3872287.1 flagellar basal body-associated protein FliL [Undibacterium flavidum]
MSKAPENPATTPPAGKSKRKLLVIIAAAVLVLAGVGGGAVFFMSKKKAPDKEHKEEAKAPVFLALEPFVVNLQSEFGEKYLQVQMTLQVPDEVQSNLIKANMPQVKSRLIMLLSSKSAEGLLTPEGKDTLIQEITTQINLPFAAKGEPQKVSGVFFTSFVVQ